MNRGGKFGKKSPHEKAKMKEKSNPRNSLKELNGSCSTSVEAPRGCFRFLLSNSSCKTTLPRSKTRPKTPKSAPNARNLQQRTVPNTSNPRSKLPKKNAPQSSFENLTEPRSQKTKSSNIFQWQNGRRTGDPQPEFHKQQSLVEIDTRTAPHLIEVVEDGVNSVKKLESEVCVTETQNKVLEVQSLAEPTNFSFGPVLEMNGTPSSKLPSVSTPDKALEEHFTTPPLHASVSPTIASASLKPSELRFMPQLDIGGTPSNKFPDCSLVYAPHKPLEKHSTTPPNSSFRSALKMNTTPLNKSTSGSDLVLTPETTSTPPIQASISPEITCESSLVSTPACFAAGHVVVGVTDKRKCRPRGILTVGEEVHDTEICNSRISLIPAPAEASMHWHLSPTNNAKMGVAEGSPEFEGLVGDTTPAESVLGFSDGSTIRLSLVPSPTEASVNCLLSPCVDSEVGVVGTHSPDFGRSMGPITFTSVSNAATSSSHRFGNSSSTSTSPWSEILEGAATSFLSKVHTSQKKKGYRYGQLVENSPMSVDSWNNCNVNCTPVSDSTSGRNAGHPNHVNAMVGDLQAMTLSPNNPVVNCDPADVSFMRNVDFPYPAKSSNSIDATQALMQSHGQTYRGEKFCRWETMSSLDLQNTSQVRISWREGLISRIFEMDELDCCQWMSEEEDVDYRRDDWFKSDSGLECDQNVSCSKLTDQNDRPLADGFGSPEFICDEQDNGKGEREIPSTVLTSCAESVSTEGGGLAASGDSDWSVFYKNQLFEIMFPRDKSDDQHHQQYVNEPFSDLVLDLPLGVLLGTKLYRLDISSLFH